MIRRRTPIKRSAPPRKKRPVPPRRGHPTEEQKGVLRHLIYEMSGGRCELNRPGCHTGPLPEFGELGVRWELVHRRAKSDHAKCGCGEGHRRGFQAKEGGLRQGQPR